MSRMKLNQRKKSLFKMSGIIIFIFFVEFVEVFLVIVVVIGIIRGRRGVFRGALCEEGDDGVLQQLKVCFLSCFNVVAFAIGAAFLVSCRAGEC